ncbi:MAG: 2Fe-2S iron-sulfur cluster-binding protein [Alphaproteobacteria bacterium]|nr:2Fe-2S iron-sulfur cluster-binding protein [Alphaproteobacteria bacterium]
MAKITFISRDGSEKTVEALDGLSVMQVAVDNDVDIEAACEGSMACATCHMVVDADWYGKLTPPTEEEEDMLDLAFGLTETSRLTCQIRVSDALDGARFSVPEE